MFSRTHLCVVTTLLTLGCAQIEGDPEELDRLEQPSICGGTTDWQGVEMYDGSLGPTVGFVASQQSAVGKMTSLGCSGTLIAPDLFLTAGHCLPGNDKVTFNYQNDPSGNPRPTTVYNVTATLEDDLGGVDYAIVKLDGQAGGVFGMTTLSALYQPPGQPITVIQHPNGIPKVVEGGTLSYLGNLMAYGDLDTLGGSSGSGILQDQTGFVVGVHTQGVFDGSCDASDPNSGWPIEAIWQQSFIVQQLSLDPAKLITTLWY